MLHACGKRKTHGTDLIIYVDKVDETLLLSVNQLATPMPKPLAPESRMTVIRLTICCFGGHLGVSRVVLAFGTALMPFKRRLSVMRCLDVIFKENATLAGDIEKAFNENEITQEVCELCAIRPRQTGISKKQKQ